MKNKKLFQKIVLIALAVAVLLALVAPAIFSQTPAAPKQEKLLNGLKVLMWPDAKADKVYVKVRIHSGSAFDPQGREGVMQLLADNIFPNEVSREFFTDDLGGNLEVITNYDFIQINASSTPENFLTMLETVATAVSNPAIDKETTVKLRNALLAKVNAIESDPAYVADQAVAKRLFGTFPYGRPQLGTPATLQKIDFADLIDAMGRFLTADNATIAVSGNFDRTLGFRAIRRYFGGWLKSDKKVPATFRQPDDPQQELLIIDSPVPDRYEIRFATRGAARNDVDYAATHIFDMIVEQRLKSPSQRRPEAVFHDFHMLPGSLTFGFGEPRAADAELKSRTDKLVRNALAAPVTEMEFAMARRTLTAAWEIGEMSDSATLWLDQDTFKTESVAREKEKVSAVSLGDVQRVQKKLQKQPMVSVLVSKPAN